MNNQSTENAELQRMVELGQALHRLEQNPDFIEVVKRGYIQNTLIVDSQEMLDIQPPIRQEALEKIQSVNYLRQYFTNVMSDAASAVEAMYEG